MTTIHGALLERDNTRIALLGRSGAGKSTLSQLLRRDCGWTILDDDTFGFFRRGHKPRVWPMGAYSRIRRDAADSLGLDGPVLPGYRDGKVFVSESDDRLCTVPSDGVELSAVYMLQPDDKPRSPTPSSDPSCSLLEPREAVGQLMGSVMYLDHRSGEFVRDRFTASAHLATLPVSVVDYRHGHHAPESVAALINQEISQLLEPR